MESNTKDTLKEACGSNQLIYDALTYLLFMDPESQITELKGIKEMEAEAEEDDSNGDKISASIKFETAARLAIYDGNVKEVKRLLKKCEKEVASKTRRVIYTTALKDLEEFLEVSKKYYDSLYVENKN